MDSSDESISEDLTNVYLGFVDIGISSEEQPEQEDTFIGGAPLWMAGVQPPENLVKCDVCKKYMALLLQCSAPIEGSANDRVIYIFMCKDYKCRRRKGCVKCVKGIVFKEKKVEEKSQAEVKFEKDLNSVFSSPTKSSNPFSGRNPFETNGNGPFGGSPFGSYSQAAASGEKKESKKDFKEENKESEKGDMVKKPETKKNNQEQYKLPEYPGYILYVEKERLRSDEDVLPPIPKDLQIEETEDAESVKEAIREKPAKGEFSSEILKDSQFQNFAKRVAHNPQQVLRYDLGGSPLVYSSKDSYLYNEIPKKLQFELQLMPKAIMDLEKYLENPVEGMEWGTIAVFTGADDSSIGVVDNDNDGNKVAYEEVKVVVEWEEFMDYTNIKTK